MRTNLQGLVGKKIEIKAQFSGFYSYRRKGKLHRSVLLTNLQNCSGQLLTKHVWINQTMAFEEVYPDNGEWIVFTGEISEYVKGRINGEISERMKKPIRIDYCVKNPREVKIISRNHEVEICQ